MIHLLLSLVFVFALQPTNAFAQTWDTILQKIERKPNGVSLSGLVTDAESVFSDSQDLKAKDLELFYTKLKAKANIPYDRQLLESRLDAVKQLPELMTYDAEKLLETLEQSCDVINKLSPQSVAHKEQSDIKMISLAADRHINSPKSSDKSLLFFIKGKAEYTISMGGLEALEAFTDRVSEDSPKHKEALEMIRILKSQP
ncbi:hypothetical protein GW915_10435 [bacterium]|nr:hypothetical protein [bacterium]